MKKAVSKDRHPALDAGSLEKAMLIIRGFLALPRMTRRIF